MPDAASIPGRDEGSVEGGLEADDACECNTARFDAGTGLCGESVSQYRWYSRRVTKIRVRAAINDTVGAEDVSISASVSNIVPMPLLVVERYSNISFVKCLTVATHSLPHVWVRVPPVFPVHGSTVLQRGRLLLR